MSLEAGAFVGLQADDHRHGRHDRQVVNLILDAAYVREPFDRTTIIVDAEGGKHPGWVNELRPVLGLRPLIDPASLAVLSADLFPPAPGISRRRALGLGLGAAGALVAVGGAGVLLLSRSGPTPPPPGPTPTPKPPLKDPNLLWARPLGNPGALGGESTGVSATPLLLDGTLYIGSKEGNFYAIDTHGAIRWSKANPGDGIWQAAVAISGTVYFCTANESDGKIFAYDALSGVQLWQDSGPTFTFTTLATADGHLYVSGYKYFGFVSELDPTNGKEVLYLCVQSDTAIPVSPPLITGGVLYINVDDGYLHALDANKPGPELWSADVGATKARQTGEKVYSITMPALSNGLVYTGSDDFSVYALDALTGRQRWRYPTGEKVRSSPAVAAETVFVGSYDHNLYALDAATGKAKWSYTTGSSVHATPVVVDSIVYIGADDGYVHAIDATTGGGIRKYRTTSNVIGSPVVDTSADVLYVTSLDDYLYAYKL